MRIGLITEEEPLAIFRNYITNKQNDKGYAKSISFLSNLSNNINYWLPSMICICNHRCNETINKLLKVLKDHGILSF